MTFEGVLHDPINFKYFKKFCIQEMSVENLLFWLEVEEYRKVDAPQYRGFLAKKIYRKYIAEGSPMAISVDDRTRRGISSPKDPQRRAQKRAFVAL